MIEPRHPIELGHLTDRKPPFRYAAYTRVGFSDTDAQGVVYYGRYLPYFDLARTEYHRHLGRVSVPACEFVMRAAAVEYHAPARFDDLLEVFVRVERVGGTSVSFDHAAYRLDDEGGDTLMVTAQQTLVLVQIADRTPVAVPDPYRALVTEFERPPHVTTAALEAVDRILNRGGDADHVLRAVVGTLVERGGCTWAAVLVAEDGRLALGPHAGERNTGNGNTHVQVPIVFGGRLVGELAAEGCGDAALVERVALLISPYCGRGAPPLPIGRDDVS